MKLNSQCKRLENYSDRIMCDPNFIANHAGQLIHSETWTIRIVTNIFFLDEIELFLAYI